MLRKIQLCIALSILFLSLTGTACPLCSDSNAEKLCDDCKFQLTDLVKTLSQRKSEAKKTQRYKIPKDPNNPLANELLWESLKKSLGDLALNPERPYMAEASGLASSHLTPVVSGASAVDTSSSQDGLDHQASCDFFEALSEEDYSQIQQHIIPLIDSLCDNEELIITGSSWISTVNEASTLLNEENHSMAISYEGGLGWFFITYDFITKSFLVLNWSDHHKYLNYSFRKIKSNDDLKIYLKQNLQGKREINSCFF